MDTNEQQQQRQQRPHNRQSRQKRQRGGRTEPLGSSYDATAATDDPQSLSSRESSPGPPRIHSNAAISTNIPLARGVMSTSTPDITRVVVQNPHPSQERHSIHSFRTEDPQTYNNPSITAPSIGKSTDADELIILNEGMSPIEPPGTLPFANSPNEKSHPFEFFPSTGLSVDSTIHEPSTPLPRSSTDKVPPKSILQIPPPTAFHPDPQYGNSDLPRGPNPVYPLPYQPTERPRSSFTINPKDSEERREWWNTEKQETTPPILIPPDLRDRSCRFCNESQSDKYEIITIDGSRKIKKGRLFSPCKCTGNMNYVHVGCLRKWQQASVEEQSSYRCESCRYQYRFYRISLGGFLASRVLVHILTIIWLFGLLYATGWVAKAFDVYVMHDPETLPEFLLLNVWHWIIGWSVIVLIGSVFLAYQIFLNGGTRGLRSLYVWACPCFIGLPGFGPTAEKKTRRFNIGFVILLLLVFTPLGVITLISGTYVLFQRSINRFLWRLGDRILNVKKRNE